MALEYELAAQRRSAYERRSGEERAIQSQAVEGVRESGLLRQALHVGDHVPSFVLPDATGESVDLGALLREGPVVVSFYRGGWCPYCNLELRALQTRLDELTTAGATLVAISPEQPDSSLSTTEKNALTFPVLSDKSNAVARSFGLVHQIDPEWVRYQLAKGIDVAALNGEQEAEVPVPATYVIASDHVITFMAVDADYTRRAEPQEILDAVRALTPTQTQEVGGACPTSGVSGVSSSEVLGGRQAVSEGDGERVQRGLPPHDPS